LIRFNSSYNNDEKDLISLEDYVSRFKEGQKDIYYIQGNSRDAINSDPHFEMFKNKGLEVLFLYDPVDEFIIGTIRKFKEFEFKSVEAADPGILEKFQDTTQKEETFEKLDQDDEKHFDSLLARFKEILGDRVTDVKESKRLVGSAVCLVSPEDGMSSTMQKILRMTNKDISAQKKTFEVNRNNKLIRNLLTIFKANAKDEYIINVIEQMFESALLMEGNLTDPYTLVNRINQTLEQSSDWYLAAKKS
jgi:molecular chaperone HtpG